MTRICVVDLETRKLAQELDPISEVGWDKLRRGEGGISALCIYDYKSAWPHIYDDHDILKIGEHLENADLVVGFRSLKFDIPVVEGILKRRLVLKKHIDIYEAIAEALAKANIKQLRGENTLGAICERTLGRTKKEKGEHAPQLAREGRWGRLMSYCMDDVMLTRDLFEHIKEKGGIVSINGTFLPVKLEI